MLRIGDKLMLRKIVFGKIGLIFFLIVFVLFAKGTWSVYQKATFAKDNRMRAEQEIEKLKEREVALRVELDRLGTERGLEEEIRHKFDVGREGEQMVVLVDAPEPEQVTEVASPSIWEKLIKLFGF